MVTPLGTALSGSGKKHLARAERSVSGGDGLWAMGYGLWAVGCGLGLCFMGYGLHTRLLQGTVQAGKHALNSENLSRQALE